jgi:hypothetical protein
MPLAMMVSTPQADHVSPTGRSAVDQSFGIRAEWHTAPEAL